MNRMPLVTIVTPSLNQGRFIRRTIESVLSQDYPNVEYWVFDGGSSDETLDILRSYGERIKWVSEPDRGQAHAVNKGWLRAQGEILSWLNADDVLKPDAVTIIIATFQTDARLATVYGQCTFIDEDDNELGFYETQPYSYRNLVTGADDFLPQPATFVRKDMASEVGFLNEEFQYVMDFDFWLRLGMHHPMVFLDTPVASLRIHQSSKTGSIIYKFAPELVQVYEKLFANSDFPVQLRAKEDIAWFNLYHRAASYSFWGGKPTQALTYLRQGWGKAHIWNKRSFWLLLLFSLLGDTGVSLANLLHGNPFEITNVGKR